MAVFFTSDHHIGHRFMAGARRHNDWGVDRDIITPEDIEWHDEMIAANWDAAVRKDDIVWVLGDISGGGNNSQINALAWFHDRPGTKHLITGNHDGAHPMHRDAAKWQRRYLAEFDSVYPYIRRKIAGQTVLLNHLPYDGTEVSDHTVEARFPQYRMPDLGEWLLHGHIHDKTTQTGKMIHVGLDAWDFKPVPLEVIEGIVSAWLS